MTVTQLQYTAWPDHDVPKSATPLIEISRTLKSLQGNRKQQVLIHCRSVMSVLLNNNIKGTCTSIFLDWEVMFLILYNQSCKRNLINSPPKLQLNVLEFSCWISLRSSPHCISLCTQLCSFCLGHYILPNFFSQCFCIEAIHCFGLFSFMYLLLKSHWWKESAIQNTLKFDFQCWMW